jgi:helix-turn-helix resolvase-like protein/serine acetyltransferase-like protein
MNEISFAAPEIAASRQRGTPAGESKLWETLRLDAERAAAGEEMLRGFLDLVVLRHDGLASGLGLLLARKLDILRQRVNAGLKAARRRGRVGGRPKSLTDADLKKARALLRSGDYTKAEIAAELGVGRHTLWRHLVAANEKYRQPETPFTRNVNNDATADHVSAKWPSRIGWEIA